MVKQIKLFIQKFIQFFGYKLIGRKEFVKHNSFNAIHKFIINEFIDKKEITIFDIGASDGSSIERFKKRFPQSKIFSFEPTEFLFDKLKKQYNSDTVKIFNNALGAKEEHRDFYQYEYHEINSFYPMVQNSKYKLQRTKKENQKNEIKKKVNVITLDSFAEKNRIKKIDVLKIDTQGAETEVLDGAQNLLKSNLVNIIELEHIIGIAHECNNSFYKLEEKLNKYNYRLIAIDHADNIISFSNYQTNLIYVNNDIFNKIKHFHENNIDVKNITHSVKHFKNL